MDNTLIEVTLALFWIAYLGLHLWLWRAEPLDEAKMTESKEQAPCTMPLAK